MSELVPNFSLNLLMQSVQQEQWKKLQDVQLIPIKTWNIMIYESGAVLHFNRFPKLILQGALKESISNNGPKSSALIDMVIRVHTMVPRDNYVAVRPALLNVTALSATFGEKITRAKLLCPFLVISSQRVPLQNKFMKRTK